MGTPNLPWSGEIQEQTADRKERAQEAKEAQYLSAWNKAI